MRLLLLGAACLAMSACGAKVDTTPNVIFETELGLIEIETYPDNDPRQMGMSLIQGGRLDTEPKGPPIVHEPTSMTGLRNNSAMVSIARDAPGTGSAAFFFINVGNNNFLDEGGERNPDGAGYATFGKVVKGMDIIKSIQAMEAKGATDEEVVRGQFLTKPVLINKAYRK